MKGKIDVEITASAIKAGVKGAPPLLQVLLLYSRYRSYTVLEP